jgi:hypothetical protein
VHACTNHVVCKYFNVLFETYMLSYLKSNSSQDWVHNLQGIIQNEDVGFLVSRELRVSLPGGGACLKTLLLQRSEISRWRFGGLPAWAKTS